MPSRGSIHIYLSRSGPKIINGGDGIRHDILEVDGNGHGNRQPDLSSSRDSRRPAVHYRDGVFRFCRIAQWHNMGLIPEEIVRKFGHLSLAQVHAALAYYHANLAEIDADLESEARETEALEEQNRR